MPVADHTPAVLHAAHEDLYPTVCQSFPFQQTGPVLSVTNREDQSVCVEALQLHRRSRNHNGMPCHGWSKLRMSKMATRGCLSHLSGLYGTEVIPTDITKLHPSPHLEIYEYNILQPYCNSI